MYAESSVIFVLLSFELLIKFAMQTTNLWNAQRTTVYENNEQINKKELHNFELK